VPGQQALRAIRQNLVFSLGMLAVAVELTVPGILNPVTGALLHELSSIPVIYELRPADRREGTGLTAGATSHGAPNATRHEIAVVRD